MTTYTDSQLADACDRAAGWEPDATILRAAASRLRGLGEQAVVECEHCKDAGCAVCGRWPHAATDQPAVPRGRIHVVFDGPPGPEAGRFVECENRAALVATLRGFASTFHPVSDGEIVDLLQRALAQIVTDGERIAAARTFLAKYDECEPVLNGIFATQLARTGHQYSGPSWATELAAMRKALEGK